ncbi:MAG: VTT domain-containing protein [Bacteroidota bacterium]|nr:VTT domain-containing protein [Bacteroidota bacterium]
MQYIIHLLTQYKYYILFPLAIVEGPIIAVIAGFLCNNGFMNPLIVYPIIVAGDIVGDSGCYLLGRLGVPSFIKRIARWFGVTDEKIKRVRVLFNTNPNKIVGLSKIILGVGVAGIYLAGNSRVPFTRFLLICLVVSALQYVFYLGLGLLFGSAYLHINQYLNNFAAINITIVLAIILFLLIKYLKNKYESTFRL